MSKLTTQGRVIAKLEPKTGTKKDGTIWREDKFVIETEEEYPKKQCFALRNKQNLFDSIGQGDLIQVEASYSSREYQGNWYSQADCFKLSIIEKNETPF
jgi:hypothetical protein